jgi:hypothetical protein
MKLNRKNLVKVIIESAAAVVIIPFVITSSNLDIYSCVSKSNDTCSALKSATWKIHLGYTLLFLAWSVLLLSVAAYIYLRIKKRP